MNATTTHAASAVATSSHKATQNDFTAAKARLSRTVVRASDLPIGWTNTVGSAADQKLIDQLNAQFVSCAGVRETDLDRVATRTTSFGGPAGSLVGSDATVYPTQGDLVNDAAIWRNPRTPECFKKIGMQGSAPDDHPTVNVTMTGRQPGQPAQVVANRAMTTSARYNGKRTTRYNFAVYVQGPLIEIEIDFAEPGSPVPASLCNHVVAAVANRATKT